MKSSSSHNPNSLASRIWSTQIINAPTLTLFTSTIILLISQIQTVIINLQGTYFLLSTRSSTTDLAIQGLCEFFLSTNLIDIDEITTRSIVIMTFLALYLSLILGLFVALYICIKRKRELSKLLLYFYGIFGPIHVFLLFCANSQYRSEHYLPLAYSCGRSKLE